MSKKDQSEESEKYDVGFGEAEGHWFSALEGGDGGKERWLGGGRKLEKWCSAPAWVGAGDRKSVV